jgi:Flp pilus assembly protein TadG
MKSRLVVNSGERGRRPERGAALVEMAVALPLLVLVVVGTIDFARVFYMTIELTNAARAGAQYGAQNFEKSSETANMESTAQSAAVNVGTIVASASRLCQCATDDGTFSSTSPPNDCTDSCAGNHLVVAVTVTATSTFTTVARIPGIPHILTISRSATMRAQ